MKGFSARHKEAVLCYDDKGDYRMTRFQGRYQLLFADFTQRGNLVITLILCPIHLFMYLIKLCNTRKAKKRSLDKTHVFLLNKTRNLNT